jgi:hypothetical protein
VPGNESLVKKGRRACADRRMHVAIESEANSHDQRKKKGWVVVVAACVGSDPIQISNRWFVLSSRPVVSCHFLQSLVWLHCIGVVTWYCPVSLAVDAGIWMRVVRAWKKRPQMLP